MNAHNTPFAQLKKNRQPIMEMGSKSPSSPTYKHTLIDRLRTQISFDAACCTSVDPRTLLSTGAFTESGVEGIHSKLLEYEYLHDDIMKYDQLVREGQSIATLHGSTQGQPDRSTRFRNVLQPAGFGDGCVFHLCTKEAAGDFLRCSATMESLYSARKSNNCLKH